MKENLFEMDQYKLVLETLPERGTFKCSINLYKDNTVVASKASLGHGESAEDAKRDALRKVPSNHTQTFLNLLKESEQEIVTELKNEYSGSEIEEAKKISGYKGTAI